MQIIHTDLFFFIKQGATVRLFKSVEWNSATAWKISLQVVYLKITYLAQQRTQSADILCETQAIHHFKFCCTYRIVKRGFANALRKTWITTGIRRSVHNKDKLHKKYLNQKRVLINKVLHEIFQRNRNTIKKTAPDTQTDYFIQGQNDMRKK